MYIELIDYQEYIGYGERQDDKRARLDFAELQRMSKESVKALELIIKNELERIVVEANIESDVYWSVIKSSVDDYTGKDRICRVGNRVVYKNDSFSIEWFKNRYVDQGHGKPKKVYSTYIRKGKGFRYSMSSFKNEPTWVQGQVEESERIFAILRERASYLTKLRVALRSYSRRCRWDYINSSKF